MSKYQNVKNILDGHAFDSKKEAKRYADLKLLERLGEIQDLELQPKFLIAESVILGGIKQRARYYFADFAYTKNGKRIAEDVKGFKTDMYRLKRHLVKLLHGVEVVEV